MQTWRVLAASALGLFVASAQTSAPEETSWDSNHRAPYIVADRDNHRIQECPAETTGGNPTCTTVAGTGSSGTGATTLNGPYAVVLDSNGDYIIVDNGNHRIQKCPAASPGSACETVAGTGSSGSGANQLSNPTGLVLTGFSQDPVRDYIICDAGNHRIQKCPSASPGSDCTTVAGTGSAGSGATQLDSPRAVVMDKYGVHHTWSWTLRTDVANPGSNGGTGDYLVADYGNHRIQRCPVASPGSACTTEAGAGSSGSGATQLNGPVDVLPGSNLVIVDKNNARIQTCPRLSSAGSSSLCMTLFGTTGTTGSGDTVLYDPTGVAVDAAGDYLIADSGNNRIQKCPYFDSNGNTQQGSMSGTPGVACTTVAGTGSSGSGATQFNIPTQVRVRECTKPDGSGVSSTYPCQCGSWYYAAGITNNTVVKSCNSSQVCSQWCSNTHPEMACMVMCSVTDGSALSSTYPCWCGSSGPSGSSGSSDKSDGWAACSTELDSDGTSKPYCNAFGGFYSNGNAIRTCSEGISAATTTANSSSALMSRAALAHFKFLVALPVTAIMRWGV